MTTITMATITREYKNNGQHAEQIARFTLTGEICKADNKPFTMGGDCGDIQIKSARATICKGLDIAEHLEKDGANRYGYVTKDFSMMYLMSKVEYLEFCEMFATVTRESTRNGGAIKLRLKDESKAMTEWLQTRI